MNHVKIVLIIQFRQLQETNNIVINLIQNNYIVQMGNEIVLYRSGRPERKELKMFGV